MNFTQLRDLARSVGFPEDSLDIAAAVALAESSGNPNAVGDPQYGYSYGLWQINLPAHPNYDPQSLFDPTYNAKAAFDISSGGDNWEPWTTYRTGAYEKYMPADSSKTSLLKWGAFFALLAGAGYLYANGYFDGIAGETRRLVASNPAGPRSMKVQSLLFDREVWTVASAKKWARSHNFRATKTDVTDDYIRLRQAPPGRFKVLRTKTFGRGIKAVVGR